MNTGAIARGYRSAPYPHAPILKHIREKGGKIILNSDAHSAEALDIAFDQALEIARSCGFTSILRLRKNGLEEIGI
jgi:histidinol-phosphatase (PHP family)